MPVGYCRSISVRMPGGACTPAGSSAVGVESLRAVLWYADIRGFTAIANSAPGLVLVDLLDDVFETLAASLRRHGGQVLKFVGDGMLAAFPCEEASRAETCRQALDAACEAMRALDVLDLARRPGPARLPLRSISRFISAKCSTAMLGAVDRLDFTMIGPAVNEVSRIEALCEPLGRKVLVSAVLAAAAGLGDGRLVPLGRHWFSEFARSVDLCARRVIDPRVSARGASRSQPRKMHRDLADLGVGADKSDLFGVDEIDLAFAPVAAVVGRADAGAFAGDRVAFLWL